MEEVIARLADRIEREGLSLRDAASSIGVTVASLRRHLDGDYVRSDSLAKYRQWLSGAGVVAGTDAKQIRFPGDFEISPPAEPAPAHAPDLPLPPAGDHPAFVVDLFSGCGGMSVGFDVLDGGNRFETVLAVDVEDAMLSVFNANRPASSWPVARRADLAEFLDESEVLAWYLHHLANLKADVDLAADLDRLPGGGVTALMGDIAAVDAAWATAVDTLRREQCLPRRRGRRGSRLVPADVGARVPPGAGDPPAQRAGRHGRSALGRGHPSGSARPPSAAALEEAEREWEERREDLRVQSGRSGRGQLASSAGKISEFLRFLDGPEAERLRQSWIHWRAGRLDVRRGAFSAAGPALRALYTGGREVSVLLGGPPCQGFSRIGRGKIRSLREHGVHARVDEEVGDDRNRLMEAYVLWVSALAPAVFLFENVRFFQAEVQTPAGTFLASEALAASIRDVSGGGLDYRATTRIIRAHDHGVPQTRERFFMGGVRGDVADRVPVADPAGWLLDLAPKSPVPLRTALEGLPEPVMFRVGGEVDLSVTVTSALHPDAYDGAEGEYAAWVRSAAPFRDATAVDAHIARPPRADDAAFFALMGPGKRWMDYRADDSQTIKTLTALLETVQNALETLDDSTDTTAHRALGWLSKLDPDEVRALAAEVDGSLPIRLLLEQIPAQPGELGHHLLTPGYLSKREGNHGDWVARLDPARPCRTIVSHMGKDTYMYVHPWSARTISVREAARVQTFPDWFQFGAVGFVDAFRVVGNAVPPLLSHELAKKVAKVLPFA